MSLATILSTDLAETSRDCSQRPIYTVRRTLPNSAPTSACRQPDSSHKRKFAFKYVPFIQRKLVLSLERKISLSGKLKTEPRRVQTLIQFMFCPSTNFTTVVYILEEYKHDVIKKSFVGRKSNHAF